MPYSSPSWFDENEYSNFLAESAFLFEMNIPYQKERIDSRKKLREFDRQTAIRRINLKRETMRDEAQAKARGIQMGLGEQFKEKLMNNFLASLSEERTPLKAEKRKMRPEVDPSDRERDRKRESRRQDSQAGLSNILIVKNNKLNKIEIITKDDFNEDSHTLLKGKFKKLDKGNVTKRDLQYYSSLENFMNTKTSVKLLGGRVEKEKKKKPTSKKGKVTKQEYDREQEEKQVTPPRPRLPVDGKEITDPSSTYPDWDHNTDQFTAYASDILNSAIGKTQSKEFKNFVGMSRTMGDASQRFVKEIFAAFPEASQMKFEKLDPVIKTGKAWSALGIKQSAPNATIVGKAKNQTVGVAIKIGEQYKPAPKGEAGYILTSALNTLQPEQIRGSFVFFIDDLLNELKSLLSTTYSVPSQYDVEKQGLQQLQKQAQKEQALKSSEKMLINRVSNSIETYVNQNNNLKTAFIYEALTGASKFNGDLGSAQIMFTAKKDGTDTKVIPLTLDFANTLAKSSDTDLSFTFQQVQPANNTLLQFLPQNQYQLNETANDVVGQIEKIKSQIISPNELLSLFGLQLTEASYQNPIIYSDFYSGNVEKNNVITINPGSRSEEQILIPVHKNFDQSGNDQNVVEKGTDALLEEYLLVNDMLVEQINSNEIELIDALIAIEEHFLLDEKRNYKKEYNNYHSKPEQRANRSKRVLARRKMMKKGKVRKGDGKDVDHKNGNPQDNSDKNLRVLSKSKNRSMNEDHGAGFEGTDQLLQNLIDQTPLAVNPVKSKLAKYIEDRYVKKIKK